MIGLNKFAMKAMQRLGRQGADIVGKADTAKGLRGSLNPEGCNR